MANSETTPTPSTTPTTPTSKSKRAIPIQSVQELTQLIEQGLLSIGEGRELLGYDKNFKEQTEPEGDDQKGYA